MALISAMPGAGTPAAASFFAAWVTVSFGLLHAASATKAIAPHKRPDTSARLCLSIDISLRLLASIG